MTKKNPTDRGWTTSVTFERYVEGDWSTDPINPQHEITEKTTYSLKNAKSRPTPSSKVKIHYVGGNPYGEDEVERSYEERLSMIDPVARAVLSGEWQTEIDQIRNDFSIKMRNTIALQRMKYERGLNELNQKLRVLERTTGPKGKKKSD